MYLAELFIENFRRFGAVADNGAVTLQLLPGPNVLVGENDCGKSTIIDAVRLLLSTKAFDGFRLSDGDFHVNHGVPASALRVRGTFRGLTLAERSRFFEWLTLVPEADPVLVVTLEASRRSQVGRAARIPTTRRTGRDGIGPALDDEAREFLQATYLRPLRDAEAELSGGRGSRLAQILEAHPAFKREGAEPTAEAVGLSLLAIMKRAENELQESDVIRRTAEELTNQYLRPMLLSGAPLHGSMSIARDLGLREVLEKLELCFQSSDPEEGKTRRGLGLNNLLFMAAELLLLSGEADVALPLLLIEEPEAHLHPQLQARLIEFLQRRSLPAGLEAETPSTTAHAVQVLLTTHSPHFASKVDLEHLTVIAGGRAYSLARGQTRLNEFDYAFLRRFLDVTKANLFFARGVLIVEGDAENLLLPVLAAKLGRPLSEFGVSVVNVGSTALFRYSKIFQRKTGGGPDVRVACIADLDIVPAAATYVRPARRPKAATEEETTAPADEEEGDDDDDDDQGDDDASASDRPVEPRDDLTPAQIRTRLLKQGDHPPVMTFVSPVWTLEHDLALFGLSQELHVAVALARKAKSRRKAHAEPLSAEQLKQARVAANASFRKIAHQCGGDPSRIAAQVYRPLYKKAVSKAEVAEILAGDLEAGTRSADELRECLPTYLVDAIDYVTRNGDGDGEEAL